MKQNSVQYHTPEGINGLELLTCSDAGYHFSPHFHDSYCIWLNISSAEAYTYKGNSGILQTGEVGIIAPGEVHSNSVVGSESRQLLTYYLNADRLQEVASDIAGLSDSSIELPTDFHSDPDAHIGLITLWQTLKNSQSTMERQSAFYEVLSLLINRYATPAQPSIDSGREQKRTSVVIELFHDRIDEDLRLDELAKLVDCTPYYLIRFFKKAIGMTPHAYLLHLRLERAKKLLRQGHSIVDTAFAIGFTDQSHLTRHFKTKFGIPPGVYQKQILSH
ncbi:helix-turn-helix domain-containing protein [Thermodesulfobacteriota bacterium]